MLLLLFLVKEHNGRRKPIDIRRYRVEFDEWALTVDINLIYEMLNCDKIPSQIPPKCFMARYF